MASIIEALSGGKLKTSTNRNGQTIVSSGNNKKTQKRAADGLKKGSYKISADTYKKYDDEYDNWKKTGQYSADFGTWKNEYDLNAYKAIKSAKRGRSAFVDGTYYVIDDDTYKRYDKEYNNWKKAGKYSDDFASWKNDDDLDAFKAVRRGSQPLEDQQLSGMDWLNSLDQGVLDRVRTAYQDGLVWDITDPEDMARKAAGQMPKNKDSYYNLKDPLDAYLYEQGLPSNKSNYLSKQYQKYLEEVEGERAEEAAYAQSFDRFKDVYFQTKQRFPDMADEDIIADIFRADTDGTYQEVANNLLRKGRENPEEMSGLDFIEWYENQDDRKENPREFTIQDLVDEYQQIYGTAPETVEEAVEGVAAAEGTAPTAPVIIDYTMLATPENAEEQLEKVETTLDNMRRGFNGYERQLHRPADPEEAKRYDSLTLQSRQLQQMIAQRDLDKAKEKLAGYDAVPVSKTTATKAAGSMTRKERNAIADILGDENFGKAPSQQQQAADLMASLGYGSPSNAEIMDRMAAQGQVQYQERESSLDRYFTAKYMTEEEKGRFSYIVENQGAKAALEYWNALEPILNQRNYEQANAEIEKAVTDYPGLASVYTVFGQLTSGVEGAVTQVSGWANELSGGEIGREVVKNDPRLRNTYINTGIRQGVSENIYATQGQLLAITYDMGMSIADNAFRAAAFGPLGGAGVALSSATMYGSVAASTTSQYLQDGASAKQALLMGSIAGAAEAVGEAVDLSKLWELKDVGDLAKKVGGNMTKGQLLRRALIRQALTEGGSESVTEIANMIADMLVMQDEAEVMQMYDEAIQKGATKGQALWQVVSAKLGDVAMAGVGGAISGVILGGGGLAMQAAKAGQAAGDTGIKAVSNGLSYMTDEANASARLRMVYEGELKNGTAVDAGTRIQMLSDLQTVGLDEKLVESYGETLDKFMASPRSLSSNEFLAFMETVKKSVLSAGDTARGISIDQKARREAAIQRLTGEYNALMELRDQARAALAAGDLKTHAKLLNELNGKMTMYTESYAAEQRKEEAAKAHDDLKQEKANRAVVDSMNELARRDAAETAYQAERILQMEEEYAAGLDQAVNEAGTLPELKEALEAQEEYNRVRSMDLEDLNTEVDAMEAELGLDDNSLYREMEAAMAAGDEARYNAAAELLEAGSENNPVEAAPQTGRKVLENFDILDYMVNGEKGAEDGTKTEGAEGNVLGGEPLRTGEGKRDYRSRKAGGKQKAAGTDGNAGRAESRRSGTMKWTARQDSDIRQAIDQYNTETGGRMGYESVRQAKEVPKNLLTAARFLKVVTGRDVFFIESDGKGFGGFATQDGKNRYVVVTGNLVRDVFNIMHESAHHMPEVQGAIFSLMEDGTISRKMFSDYKERRRQRIAQNRGIPPRSVNLGSEAKLKVEFACDLAGAYADEALLGRSMWEDYGIDEETVQKVRDAIDDALMVADISEENAGETAAEKSYATLARMGAAITAEVAEGNVWFSENGIDPTLENSGFPESIEQYDDETKRNIVRDFAKYEMSGVNTSDRIILGTVPEILAKDVQERSGINIFGLKNVLHSDGLRHGSKHNGKTGNIQITPEDVVRALDIFENYDRITVTEKRGESSIKLQQTTPDGITYIAVIGKKKGHIFTKNIWKTGNTKDGRIRRTDTFTAPASTPEAAANIRPSYKSSLSFLDEKNNRESGSSQFNFSTNAPESEDAPMTLKQSRLKTAYDLYEEGYGPLGYYQMDPDNYDQKTANLLRGIMLRNGENVGGALSEDRMGYIKDILSRTMKQWAGKLTFSSPVRILEDITGWHRAKSDAERAAAIKNGNYLKDTIYEFGNQQAANRVLWIREQRQKVLDAMHGHGRFDQLESTLVQMVGEGMLTEQQAKNAVTDGKKMIIPVQDGVFVLDGKSRILYTSDKQSSTRYDEKFRDRARRAWDTKGLSGLAVKPRSGKPMRLAMEGNKVTVYSAAGEVVAEIENGTKPNMEAVMATVDAMRTFYEQAYHEIMIARLENGYPPLGYIENYFPHMGRTYDGVEGFMDALMSNDLPTSINGLTGMFSPGQPWNANLQQRIGNFTEFDAVRGFNRYVESAGDTIFHTPVIQRLRQLERAVREQGAAALGGEDAKRNSAFASWLHEYANEWANKKASLDRELESALGREVYKVSDWMTSLVGGSAVGGSISSAMSNMVGALTGYAQVDGKYVPAAIIRTVSHGLNKQEDDGFIEKIPFLTRRFVDNEKILLQKVDKFKDSAGKAMYYAFSAVDRFAVESVARAKYEECIREGMTEAQAVKATDDMLIKNFSDRGKGQNARVYNIKWLRPIVQFQNEVHNQLYHFRDINRAEIERKLQKLEEEAGGAIQFDEDSLRKLTGGAEGIKKKIGYLVLLSIWGIITRAIMGRDQSWNPAGMAVDAVRDYKEGGAKQAWKGAKESAMDNLPFVSITTGGGRIPLTSNLSYVTDALGAILSGEADSLSNADWIKGATAMVPGGGQLRKTLTGLDALNAGGYYTADGKLRYPITKKDAARAALFGPSSVAPRNYDWSDTLSKDETEQYRQMVDGGMEAETVFDIMLAYGDGSNKAQRALTLATVAEDLPEKEFDLMMEVLGIKPKDEKGNAITKDKYVDWAVEQGKESLEQSRDKYEEGDLTEKTMKKYEEFFEEYFKILGITIAEGA